MSAVGLPTPHDVPLCSLCARGFEADEPIMLFVAGRHVRRTTLVAEHAVAELPVGAVALHEHCFEGRHLAPAAAARAPRALQGRPGSA